MFQVWCRRVKRYSSLFGLSGIHHAQLQAQGYTSGITIVLLSLFSPPLRLPFSSCTLFALRSLISGRPDGARSLSFVTACLLFLLCSPPPPFVVLTVERQAAV